MIKLTRQTRNGIVFTIGVFLVIAVILGLAWRSYASQPRLYLEVNEIKHYLPFADGHGYSLAVKTKPLRSAETSSEPLSFYLDTASGRVYGAIIPSPNPGVSYDFACNREECKSASESLKISEVIGMDGSGYKTLKLPDGGKLQFITHSEISIN